MAETFEGWEPFAMSIETPSYEEFYDTITNPDTDEDEKLRVFGKLYKSNYYSMSSSSPLSYVPVVLRQRSFVDELDGKRFDRYISKANANVLHYAYRAYPEMYNSMTSKPNADTGSLAPAVKALVIDACVFAYLDYMDLLPRDDNTLFDLIKLGKYHVICSSKKYSDFANDIRHGRIDIISTVSRVQKAVYKDYLKEYALQYSKYEQFPTEAIMQYIPESNGDCARIFKDIVSRTYFELITEYNATHDEEHTELAHEKELMRKSNEIQALNTKLKDLEAINARQEAEIENLKAVKESAKPVVIDRSQELLEADARYSVLNEKYEKLLTQYNDLKSSGKDCSVPLSEDDAQDEGSTQPVCVDVDVEAPYLFIVDRNAKFENYIRETFPNAEFTMSDLTIDFNKYTMVIIITSRVSHSMYAKFKDRCKDCGANYIHCAHTNTDRIKQLIGEQLAKS